MNAQQQAMLASPKRLFIFVRADGFYTIELPEATVADNARCNPGTLRVEDAQTGNIVWQESSPAAGGKL